MSSIIKAVVIGSAVACASSVGVAHATLSQVTFSTLANNIRLDGAELLPTGRVSVVMTTDTNTRVETPFCGPACPEAIRQDFTLVSISMPGFTADLQGGFRAEQFRTSTFIAQFGTLFSYGGVAGGPLGTYQSPITDRVYQLDASALHGSSVLLADGRTITFVTANPQPPSTLAYTLVPEPSTWALMGLGLGLLGLVATRRRLSLR